MDAYEEFAAVQERIEAGVRAVLAERRCPADRWRFLVYASSSWRVMVRHQRANGLLAEIEAGDRDPDVLVARVRAAIIDEAKEP